MGVVPGGIKSVKTQATEPKRVDRERVGSLKGQCSIAGVRRRRGADWDGSVAVKMKGQEAAHDKTRLGQSQRCGNTPGGETT